MKIQEKIWGTTRFVLFFSISEVSGVFLSARAQKIGEKRGTGRQKIRRYANANAKLMGRFADTAKNESFQNPGIVTRSL